MNLAVIATAFLVILPVELPDKTFIATLVLATRFRPLYVWLGVGSAFFVHSLIAVTAGGLLTLLPRLPVLLAAGVLFAVGSVLLWRSAGRVVETGEDVASEFGERVARYSGVSGPKAIAVSFGVLMLAEWGDLSQLFTAGLAARSGQPLSVFIGAWGALLLVSGLAALLGRALLTRLPLSLIQRVAAGVCLVLSALTFAEALGLI